MSKYTCSICKLIDNGFDFGLNDYPIFDENYREPLNRAILDYFYMYEIGFETPYLFRHYLRNKMDLIMPKFNAMLIAQTKIIENPLGNTDVTEMFSRIVDNEGESISSAETNSKSLFQDTPQGEISQTDMDNQTWATNLNLDRNKADDKTNTTGKTVENYTKHLMGNSGKQYNIDVYNKLVNSFRSVNQLIINELEPLFMGVL